MIYTFGLKYSKANGKVSRILRGYHLWPKTRERLWLAQFECVLFDHGSQPTAAKLCVRCAIQLTTKKD